MVFALCAMGGFYLVRQTRMCACVFALFSGQRRRGQARAPRGAPQTDLRDESGANRDSLLCDDPGSKEVERLSFDVSLMMVLMLERKASNGQKQ